MGRRTGSRKAFLRSNGFADIFSISQPLRLYANPGEDVVVAASRLFNADTGVTGVGSGDVVISGYLVDVP